MDIVLVRQSDRGRALKHDRRPGSLLFPKALEIRTREQLDELRMSAQRGGYENDLLVTIPWGRFRIWIAARGTWWVRAQTMQVDAKTNAGSARHDLPSWGVQGALGLSYVLSAP